MEVRDLVLSALRALRAHKLRSFLTLLGVIIGVTTIVGVVAVISGLDTYVKEKVIRLAPDVYVVDRFGLIQSEKEFIQALKRPLLTWHDFERLLDAGLPHVARVSTRALKSMRVDAGPRHLSNCVVVGCTPNFSDLFKFEFEGGRFFTDNENDMSANVAAVGADIKDELFPGVDPIGKTFLIRGLPFRIIGLFPRQGRTLGMSRDSLVCVPIQVYRKNFMSDKDSLSIQVEARRRGRAWTTPWTRSRLLMRALRHTSFHDPDPFGIITQDSLQDTLEADQPGRVRPHAAGLLREPGRGRHRHHEHHAGERDGAHHRDRHPHGHRREKARHRRQVLLEASILSLCGGILGVLAGVGRGVAGAHGAGFPAQVTLGLVVSSIAVSTLVGLAAGFLPARRASNLPVIDALRAE